MEAYLRIVNKLKIINNIYKSESLIIKMRKELTILFILTILSSIFLINFISAQFYGGYGYGGFSLTDLFNRFDPQEMISVSLFLILFIFVSSALKKVGLFD